MEKSKVYFTKEITPESLIWIYKALGVELKGKVGVKISTGEPGGHNYPASRSSSAIWSICSNGTIIECCTAYGGRRHRSHGALEGHRGTRLQGHGPLRHHGRAWRDGSAGAKRLPSGQRHRGRDILPTTTLFWFCPTSRAMPWPALGGALKNISIGIGFHPGQELTSTPPV